MNLQQLSSICILQNMHSVLGLTKETAKYFDGLIVPFVKKNLKSAYVCAVFDKQKLLSFVIENDISSFKKECVASADIQNLVYTYLEEWSAINKNHLFSIDGDLYYDSKTDIVFKIAVNDIFPKYVFVDSWIPYEMYARFVREKCFDVDYHDAVGLCNTRFNHFTKEQYRFLKNKRIISKKYLCMYL